MHRVGYRVHEIDNSEEPDKAPALKVGIEGEVHYDRGREYSDDEPGLEFTPACACAFDDVAHYGVIERVEYSRGDDDSRYRAELSIREAAREQNIGYDAACEQVIYHIPADGAEREHDKIFLSLLEIFHCNLQSYLN